MKLTKILLTAAAPVAALSLGTVLMTPSTSEGYSLIGGSLNQNQRDFRVFNNFTDNVANNNQTPDDQFPGYQGATMAIWKGVIEWGSGPHGDGTGDPSQTTLGSGQANFDPSFQGEANGVGNTNNNIHSELSGSQGGVLAYCETPISDGWRIRYYSGWTWADGPGTNIGGGVDLQGVACHEYGHALGLGHSQFGSATMGASISGNGVSDRSISSDDQNGVQAVYGAASGNKPVITGVAVNGGQITVTGSNFDSTGNQIWFTQAASGGNGTPIKATNLNSDGTTITAFIPAAAGPGDILVRRNSTGNSGLSNAWPTDLSGSTGGGGAPTITTIAPTIIDALVPDGQTITVTGTNLTGTTEVVIDGIVLTDFPPQFVVQNDTTLTFTAPQLTKLGTVDIQVTSPSGTANGGVFVQAPPQPVVELANSDPLFIIQGVGLEISVGGQPGDIAFIGISPQLLPTPLPGLIDQPLSIGNNFTTLFQLGKPVVGNAGYTTKLIPVQGIPGGTQLHVQTATLQFANGYAFPAIVSNVQTGTVLF